MHTTTNEPRFHVHAFGNMGIQADQYADDDTAPTLYPDRPAVFDLVPELSLLLAMLDEAWVTATGTRGMNTRGNIGGRKRVNDGKHAINMREFREREAEREHREAIEWFADDSDESPFTFVGCCQMLGIDHRAIRIAVENANRRAA